MIALLEAGADPDLRGSEADGGEFAKCPLHRVRNPKLVPIFLDYGANPYVRMKNKNVGERSELSAFEARSENVHCTVFPV